MRKVEGCAVSPWLPITSSIRYSIYSCIHICICISICIRILFVSVIVPVFVSVFVSVYALIADHIFHQEVGGGDVAATVLQMLYHVREANAVFLTKVITCLLLVIMNAFFSGF